MPAHLVPLSAANIVLSEALTASRLSGDIATAIPAAQEVLAQLRVAPDSLVAPELVGDLDKLIAGQRSRDIEEDPNPDIQEEALHLVEAVASTLLHEQGPDDFVSSDQVGIVPLALRVSEDRHVSNQDIDQRTKEKWGPEFLDKVKKVPKGLKRRLQDFLFQGMLQNEGLKKQFVRFMGAVAGLNDYRVVGKLFREYFPISKTKASWRMKTLLTLGKLGLGDWDQKIGLDWVRGWVSKKVIRMMTKRFILGRDATEVIAQTDRLAERHINTTVVRIQERVSTDDEKQDYVAGVIDLVQKSAARDVAEPYTPGGVPVRHVSLKMTGMEKDFDPLCHDQVVAAVVPVLVKIFQEAKLAKDAGRPVMIQIDPEEHHLLPLTYEIFWKALADPSLAGWDDAGIAVQMYYPDSLQRLMWNISMAARTGKRIQIRLVKGAYHAYEQILAARNGWRSPVFTHPDLKKSQRLTNESYRLGQRLLHRNWDKVREADASHNIADQAYGRATSERLGLNPARREKQILIGVGDDVVEGLTSPEDPGRGYAPSGLPPVDTAYNGRRTVEVGPDSAMRGVEGIASFADYHPVGRETVVNAPEFKLEPEAEFHKREVREEFQRALQQLESSPPVEVRPIIGLPLEVGETLIPLDRARAVPSVNPANTKQVVGLVQNATPVEVERALDEAQAGFAIWSKKTGAERAAVLRRAADLVRERASEIAARIVAEAGKPQALAYAEVNEAIDTLNLCALRAEIDSETHDPLGVGVAITPFNFPFAISMIRMVEGLALGNAMILKPPDQCPAAAQLVVEILRAAGVPPQACQLVPGPGKEVGEPLVMSPKVDFIGFTGSKAAADRIRELAAQHPSARNGIKLVVAETGGKNPIIVDESADLDVAVDAIIRSGFEFNGERCSAGARLIVHDSVADELLRRLKAAAESMMSGNPLKNPLVKNGAQIDAAALAKAKRYERIAREGRGADDEEVRELDKATLFYAKDVSDLGEDGYWFGAHIYTDVHPDSRLAQEEIFAPILSVFRYKKFDEAIRLANNSANGLVADLISQMPSHVRMFFEQVEAGNKYVNRAPVGARPYETPFGGGKNSGTGPKSGGEHVVARFGKLKIATWRPKSNFIFPLEAAREVIFPGHQEAIHPKNLMAAQRSWARTPLPRRLKFLRNLRRQLSACIGCEGPELVDLIRDRIDPMVQAAPQYLTPRETIGLPGERNEVVHDWALGAGLIGTAEESYADVLTAAAAAIVMGNAIVLPASKIGIQVARELDRAGAPRDLIQLVSRKTRELLEDADFDFVVTHGRCSQAVHQKAIGRKRNGVGFTRFIGGHDSPVDPRYLTYFAYETVRTERTIVNASDVDLRDVLGR